MPYGRLTPSNTKRVDIEWVDITSGADMPGVTRRWTLGCRLLSTTHLSEGVECTIVARTWDEDGWCDFDTFPNSIILSLEDS